MSRRFYTIDVDGVEVGSYDALTITMGVSGLWMSFSNGNSGWCVYAATHDLRVLSRGIPYVIARGGIYRLDGDTAWVFCREFVIHDSPSRIEVPTMHPGPDFSPVGIL